MTVSELLSEVIDDQIRRTCKAPTVLKLYPSMVERLTDEANIYALKPTGNLVLEFYGIPIEII